VSYSSIRSIIYIILVAVTVGAGLYAFFNQESDLGLNLFAEAVGGLFTVLIIENLFRGLDKTKNKPARLAGFRDAHLVYGRCVGLWINMVKSAFNPSRDTFILEDKNIKLLDEKMGDIVAHLNLESKAPVVPKRKWHIFLSEQVGEIEQYLDRCLQRYAAYLDPELIVRLQEVEGNSFMLVAKHMKIMPIVDSEIGVTRSPEFGWGANGSAKDFLDAVIGLGSILSEIRPQFDGLPKVPALIDLEHKGVIQDLRSQIELERENSETSE